MMPKYQCPNCKEKSVLYLDNLTVPATARFHEDGTIGTVEAFLSDADITDGVVTCGVCHKEGATEEFVLVVDSALKKNQKVTIRLENGA